MPLFEAIIYPADSAGYSTYEIVNTLTKDIPFKSSGPANLVRELAGTKLKEDY